VISPLAPARPRTDVFNLVTRGWRAYALIAALTICATLPGFFSIPPLDRDESRFAQATAQMLETGDFVRIAVQEDPRNKKPVGIHWLQAASVAATSSVETREIWAYRAPSMAGAVLAALATRWAGTALIGRRAAFIGAALLGVSLLLSTEGMIAKTDAVLCGVTTLMLAAMARLRVRQPGQSGVGLAFLAWAALGVGVLIKGPITPAVGVLTLGTLALWERRAAWMRPLAQPWGPLAAAAIVAPWLIAIQISTNGAFLSEAVGHDLGTKISGGGEHPFTPPGLHLALLPILSFPMAVGLVPAARLAWAAARAPRASDDHANLRFLIAWAVPTFLMFELTPTKLAHYTLPAYPAIALLAGAVLTMMMAQSWTRTRWASVALASLSAAALVTVCAAMTTLFPGSEAVARSRMAETAVVGGAAAAAWLVALAMTRRPEAWLALALTAGLAFSITARERLAPEMDGVLVSRAASQALVEAALHPRLSAGAGPLWIVGYREPSLVFSTVTAAKLADGEAAGREATVGSAVLVEQRERSSLDRELAARGLRFAPIGPAVNGQNYSNGETVALQPGRIDRVVQAAD
jgi:4-amino-4-deoxy-L-arabinose transferase-like glycosyltransferase